MHPIIFTKTGERDLTLEPVTTYVLSIFIYGKLVGSFELVGIAFVFANVIIISIQSQKTKTNDRDKDK